ncbi:MAG: winged helix DNA-binding protein, partial [Exilibacterium sp.]
SICIRYSGMPMGVTDYLGQTKGTISQSLKNLERKGLIEKLADSEDKRVVHLQLTQAGHAVVDSLLPSPLLQSAGKNLSKQDTHCLEIL